MKKYLPIIISLIIIVGAIVSIALLLPKTEEPSNKEPPSNNSFVVSYNDEYLCSEDTIFFVGAGFHELKVKTNNSYEVLISFNKEIPFAFTVDGKKTTSSDLQDVTKHFNVIATTNGFKIDFSDDFSVLALLQELYPDKEVMLSEDVSKKAVFILTLNELGSEEFFKINFNFSEKSLLIISPGDIVL